MAANARWSAHVLARKKENAVAVPGSIPKSIAQQLGCRLAPVLSTPLPEVVVFFHGFVDLPRAFEVLGEDHEVAGAEGY